jgi:hypothetical protein
MNVLIATQWPASEYFGMANGPRNVVVARTPAPIVRVIPEPPPVDLNVDSNWLDPRREPPRLISALAAAMADE